jgi:phage N-6-adenine-methyltransferase
MVTKLQQVRIADIQIGKRHRKEMGDLTGLARSIQEIGLLQPIGVKPDLTLVFGHRRLLACQSLDHELIPACIVDIDAIILGEYAENEFRKDFTLSERVEIGRALEVELGERRGRPENVANCAQFPGEKTRDIVAKRAGFSSGTSYERAQFVVDAGVPELVEAVDRGEASVSAAAQVATLPVEWQRVIVANDEVAQVAKEIRNGHAHDVGARIRPHVAHNAGNNEWYTPAEYIQAAATVLGGIDLDPASTADANAVVGAAQFYTAQDNGLDRPWRGRIWLNPPYAVELIGLFAAKLVRHVKAGDVASAIVLVNNATETAWFHELAGAASAICFPRGRIKFWAPDGRIAQPLQGQALIYLGNDADAFQNAFTQFGWCARL